MSQTVNCAACETSVSIPLGQFVALCPECPAAVYSKTVLEKRAYTLDDCQKQYLLIQMQIGVFQNEAIKLQESVHFKNQDPLYELYKNRIFKLNQEIARLHQVLENILSLMKQAEKERLAAIDKLEALESKIKAKVDKIIRDAADIDEKEAQNALIQAKEPETQSTPAGIDLKAEKKDGNVDLAWELQQPLEVQNDLFKEDPALKKVKTELEEKVRKMEEELAILKTELEMKDQKLQAAKKEIFLQKSELQLKKDRMTTVRGSVSFLGMGMPIQGGEIFEHNQKVLKFQEDVENNENLRFENIQLKEKLFRMGDAPAFPMSYTQAVPMGDAQVKQKENNGSSEVGISDVSVSGLSTTSEENSKENSEEDKESDSVSQESYTGSEETDSEMEDDGLVYGQLKLRQPAQATSSVKKTEQGQGNQETEKAAPNEEANSRQLFGHNLWDQIYKSFH